jgi:hypothetical protein
LIFTYKEGVLSRVAHDLKLACKSFRLHWDDEGVRATFDPRSVHVICAMKRGQEDHRALSDKDRKQVDDNVAKSVLHVTEHAEIRFEAPPPKEQPAGWTVDGTLSLHGRSRPVRATVVRKGDQLTTRVRIHQPDFGIKPFKALMGAIRVKPDLDVELTLTLQP